jgi:hypothetical protein
LGPGGGEQEVADANQLRAGEDAVELEPPQQRPHVRKAPQRDIAFRGGVGHHLGGLRLGARRRRRVRDHRPGAFGPQRRKRVRGDRLADAGELQRL